MTAEDAARLLVNACDPDVPAEFWGGIRNIGGGEAWRLTNWQLQTMISGALGVEDVRRWYERNWFATRNFHGQCYSDSDRLEQLVPFRRDTPEIALARAVAALPATVRSAGRMPPWIIKNLVMKPIARKPRGTMDYVRRGDEAGIAAFFGSREAWEAIGDWSTFWPPRPDRTPTLLDHGYDESKHPSEWAAPDYLEAAGYRGGELLSTDAARGDVATPLHWRCAYGHEFAGSPRLVLTGGHWCPVCVRDVEGYARQAERNPGLAQLEYPSGRTFSSQKREQERRAG